MITDDRGFQEIPAGSAGGNTSGSASDPRIFQEIPVLLSESIDIDLASMSGTVAYAMLTNMKMDPESYEWQSIKAAGTYSSWYFDGTGLIYHFIVIEGPPGCCPGSLEFILHSGDYPAENEKIDLVGVFNSYDELGGIYYYLAVDDLIVSE